MFLSRMCCKHEGKPVTQHKQVKHREPFASVAPHADHSRPTIAVKIMTNIIPRGNKDCNQFYIFGSGIHFSKFSGSCLVDVCVCLAFVGDRDGDVCVR